MTEDPKDYFKIKPDPPLPKYEPPEGPPNPDSRTMAEAIRDDQG